VEAMMGEAEETTGNTKIVEQIFEYSDFSKIEKPKRAFVYFSPYFFTLFNRLFSVRF
jgi:hypothetical protein